MSIWLIILSIRNYLGIVFINLCSSVFYKHIVNVDGMLNSHISAILNLLLVVSFNKAIIYVTMTAVDCGLAIDEHTEYMFLTRSRYCFI